jgi:hypothetical protein
MAGVPGYNQVQVQKMDPATIAYRQRLMDQSQGAYDTYSKWASGDPAAFEALEKPAFRDFQKTLGQVGSRYAGTAPGAMSARNSSSFQAATSEAGADLAERLQSQRLGLQQHALDELGNLSSQLLGSSPYEYALQKKKKKWWETLLGGAAPLIGGVAGGLFGGPLGAAAGAAAGSSFGSSFLD